MRTIFAKSVNSKTGQPAAEPAHDNRALVAAMVNSPVYREYEQAFSILTGLPIALQPVETWQLAHHGSRNENALCALISAKSNACAACLQLQARLCRKAATGPQTLTCTMGLSDSAVPVRLHDRVIGYLKFGQVFRNQPTDAQFKKVCRQIKAWGIKADRQTLKQAYFSGKVVSPVEHQAFLKLLAIFAEQLAVLGNQMQIQTENAEPPVITKARAFIEAHQTEDIGLIEVARAVNTSTYYFCKVFKRYAGLGLTEYIIRARIEKSKNLLLNPNLRVSEIAYDVGFQSLTHFNRVFKRILCQSPTDYRTQLARN